MKGFVGFSSVVDVCALNMPFPRVLRCSRHVARLFFRFAASLRHQQLLPNPFSFCVDRKIACVVLVHKGNM